MKNTIEIINDKLPVFLYPFALADSYKKNTGNRLNLLHPTTLSAKIQWIKLFDATKEKGKWSDKAEARKLFAEKIPDGEKYLKPLLGTWNNFDEIDFQSLPNMFILKSTHGCGFHSFIINKDYLLSSPKQFELLKLRTDFFQNTRYYLKSLELQYKYIKPRLIAEEIIGGINSKLYTDWSIYCFNGNPLFAGHTFCSKNADYYSVYNENFEKEDFSINFLPPDTDPDKPMYYQKMFDFARILSKDFKFVRVDFVEDNNKLYFTEMTFTPYSGYMSYNGLKATDPESIKTDRRLGNLLKLL